MSLLNIWSVSLFSKYLLYGGHYVLIFDDKAQLFTNRSVNKKLKYSSVLESMFENVEEMFNNHIYKLSVIYLIALLIIM